MDQFIKIRLPRTFSQNDTRWKASQLGGSGTIGAYGCTMVDITMIAAYYGASDDPLTMNKRLLDGGGYQVNLIKWYDVGKILGLIYSGKFSNSNLLTEENMNQIRGAIDKGYPVLLQIDTVPATSTKDEHWILAIGYDGADFIIQDPWDGATKRITSWGVKPQKLIYEWCWYEGKVPKPATNDPVMEIKASERDFLVSRSTVAKEVGQYLELSNPDHAPIEAYTKVIGGLKGTQTELNNKLNTALADKSKAEQEGDNKIEELARKEVECYEQEKLLNSTISNLNKQLAGGNQPLKEALARIEALRRDVDTANNKAGKLLIENKSLTTDLDACKKGLPTKSKIKSITDYIKSVFAKK